MIFEYNIPEQKRGDTFKGKDFQIILNGNELPLDAADIKVEFRRNSQIGTVGKTLSVGNGITITDANAGIFSFDEFDIEMKPGLYYYDVQVTKNGKITTYIEGTWSILQDTTQ